MMNRFESLVERQIREAQERGEFDDLPGAGKPLPGRGEGYDENWWIKDLVRRENVSGVLPAAMALRKEVDELPESLAAVAAESLVRDIVGRLNERIRRARRGLVNGPAVTLPDLDVEKIVQAWRAARRDRPRRRS